MRFLTETHLADLRRSGLSYEQITQCGFHSLTGAEAIQNVLRWKSYSGQLGDCLAIPFVGSDGKPTAYCRLKPDKPRMDKGGKPIRYESPYGLVSRAYFPPGTLHVLDLQDVMLLVTEGEKKAAKADQDGFPCIGLVGVYGWQRRRQLNQFGIPTGKRHPLDELLTAKWDGRPVCICYDSDAAHNPNVQEAEENLARALRSLGAMVKILRLPTGEPEHGSTCFTPRKHGLDDYLVANGANALKRLILSTEFI